MGLKLRFCKNDRINFSRLLNMHAMKDTTLMVISIELVKSMKNGQEGNQSAKVCVHFCNL